jgi:hypothetical protein
MSTNIKWIGSAEDRIISIRKFRKYISTLPLQEAVQLTKNQWESGPFLNQLQFDIAELSCWPTPWELFSKNSFCKNSQCLGTLYTLVMSEHGKDNNFALAIIDDVIEGAIPAILVGNDYQDELSNYNVRFIITAEEIKHNIKEK